MVDSNPNDRGWYAVERAHFEGKHLADLQANCWVCRGDQLTHMTWPDIHVCPRCHRDRRPRAQDAASDEAEGLRPLTPDDIASHSYLLTRGTETAR
jgi:hypothetical protein